MRWGDRAPFGLCQAQVWWAFFRRNEPPRPWAGIAKELIRAKVIARVQRSRIKKRKVDFDNFRGPPGIAIPMRGPIPRDHAFANRIPMKIKRDLAIGHIYVVPGKAILGNNPFPVETGGGRVCQKHPGQNMTGTMREKDAVWPMPAPLWAFFNFRVGPIHGAVVAPDEAHGKTGGTP